MANPTAPGSVDPGEIRKFSALAARWWDPDGPFGALHRMNPVRLGYIREQAARRFRAPGPRPLQGLSALDIGCGGGLVAEPLARLGATVTGIDGSEEAVAAASAHAQAAGLTIEYQAATAEALAERGDTFDLVTALEILEHVADVSVFLAAASALVKPGGTLIVSTINRTQKAKALAIFGAERVLKWAPEGAHDYEKLVTPEEIIAGAPSLRWQEPVGISYNPLGQGWSLSRDVSMNYLMAGDRAD
jgi:2-polyprenyl-6-hydroxyphenyl methylase/3-demethylubiquinone-9 3-methyltransferase